MHKPIINQSYFSKWKYRFIFFSLLFFILLSNNLRGQQLDSIIIVPQENVNLRADQDHEFDQGSNVEVPQLTSELINNLAVLGRIWGFMKYHHSAIAAGEYNWDYELFRFLPKYLHVENTKDRNELLKNWIASYGEQSECNSCTETSKTALLKPDLSWIEKSDFSTELKEKLKTIYMNRNQGENYYIKVDPEIGNPVFTHERAYEEMPFPDKGFRLLALYRYWNMIHYFSPNKHLTDKPWSEVLKEYIPKFMEAGNELEYELVNLKMIGELKDTHAIFWEGDVQLDSLRGDNYAPFQVRYIEDQWVMTDYYNPEYKELEKIEVGDVLTHINGNPVQSIVDSLRPYYPASNEPTVMRNISLDLLRSRDTLLEVTYRTKNNQVIDQEIRLFPEKSLDIYLLFKADPNEKSYKIMEDHIGYVNMANIREEDVAEIEEKLRDTRGMIVDLRNYPSAFVPLSLGDYFVSKSTPFIRFSSANSDNPGEFILTETMNLPGQGAFYEGKLVVLVNEITQSMAEYTALALRAGKNTTIIGSTTAGADGNVSPIKLPGGLITAISGIGVYYPDGTETQRIGVVPDRRVIPTIKGVREGRDEVLEEAIAFIREL